MALSGADLFVAGPAHTFADLASAIDNAFARWDLSHLSLFTLADGRVVTDGESGADFATSPFRVMPTAALDIGVAKVMGTVERGARFRYVFDLGDDWTHCCTVDTVHIDPTEVLGVIPRARVRARSMAPGVLRGVEGRLASA